MPAARPTALRRLAAALALAVSAAHAQSPLPSAAPVGGVAAVTPEPSAVVTLRGGSFVMGADPALIDHARTACIRELERFAEAQGGSLNDDTTLAGFDLQLRVCGVERFAHVMCGPDYFAHEAVAHEVWLPAFAIDRTEVTVAAYGRCVRAGRCAAPLDRIGNPQSGAPALPVTGVSWDDAQRYCRFAGGRLPSEAEWERAARGRDGRTYPWGWVLDGRRFNHGAVAPECHDDDDGFALVAPVGSFPDGASPEGVLDLAGNALEWVADRAAEDRAGYPFARAVDPRGPPVGTERVVRGGSFALPMFLSRATARLRRPAGTRERDLGFRCAYDRP